MNYFPEWPYCSFAVCELSLVYQEFQTGGGISHSFLCLDTLGCFPNLLCQMWENLFIPRKGFQESPERFNSLTIKSESLLQKGWVTAHGQTGPRLFMLSSQSQPELKVLPKPERSFKRPWSQCLGDVPFILFHFNCSICPGTCGRHHGNAVFTKTFCLQ